MRIAFNAWFLDQPLTGSGQYVRNLLAALREIASAVEIVPVLPRSRNDVSKVWFEQSEFPRSATRMRADLAFVPYWAPPLECGIPVVATIHDIIPLALSDYRGGPLQRMYTALVRAASSSATHVLTDSEASKHDILSCLEITQDRVTVVPLAADRYYSPAIPCQDLERARDRYDLPEAYVFYLGSFDPRKNIETLFQIYVWCGATIGEQFPLLITGDADTIATASNGRKMTLGAMARELNLDSNEVRFIGRVAEEDKPALYAGARCFVFTSLYEGFGLPVLEAMACGTPIVGSDASSIPEVVGNAGILVDPHDARRMAGAVIAVCTEDELHEKLSQRALMRAAQFSWQRTALETLAVFNRILANT